MENCSQRASREAATNDTEMNFRAGDHILHVTNTAPAYEAPPKPPPFAACAMARARSRHQSERRRRRRRIVEEVLKIIQRNSHPKRTTPCLLARCLLDCLSIKPPGARAAPQEAQRPLLALRGGSEALVRFSFFLLDAPLAQLGGDAYQSRAASLVLAHCLFPFPRGRIRSNFNSKSANHSTQHKADGSVRT